MESHRRRTAGLPADEVIDMAKIYQPIKNNPYRLRDGVYWRVIYDIKDAGRFLDGYFDDYLQEYAPTQDVVDKVLQAKQEEPDEYRE